MSDFVKEWPRAKVGLKMVVNFRARACVVEGGKNWAKKEYSKVALSIRARLKWKNGVSRRYICLFSSAR